MAVSLKELMKKAAAAAPVAAATSAPVIPAGKYLATKPRFQLILATGSKNSKNPDKPYARLDLHFDVTDPKLEELDLPVIPVRWQDLLTTWGIGASSMDFKTIYDEETNENVVVGLDLSKNVNFGKAIGKMAFAWGLAEGSIDAPIFPEDGEIMEAFYLSDNYLKALGSLIGSEEQRSEMMLDVKDVRVDDPEKYPLVLAQHQIVAIQTLVSKYNKQNPLTFRLTLAVAHDDFVNAEVNRVTGVSLVIGDVEARLL